MVNRPEALAAEFKIDSLETADQALHELAWCAQKLSVIDAAVEAKINALKQAAADSAVVEIDGESVLLVDRLASLRDALEKWSAKHVEKHLDGGKRSINLAHGTLGLRQVPLVAELGNESSKQSALDAIDAATELVKSINALLEKKTAVGNAKGRDILAVKIEPDLKAIKDAVVAKRLTWDDVKPFGIVPREAFDKAVVEPTKQIVIA